MSSSIEAQVIGIKELRAAVKRNPQKVRDEVRLFLTRGLSVYKQGILRSPWRVGSAGGGSPVSNDPRYARPNQKVRSGNLRDSHKTVINGFLGRIKADISHAPYAGYVHDGTRRMKKRPWLTYVKKTKEGEIKKLYENMLTNIVKDLAK